MNGLRLTSRALLAAAFGCALASLWGGDWAKWAGTAVLCLCVAAALGGAADKQDRDRKDKPS